MSGIETVRISEERRNGMVYCRERWAMVGDDGAIEMDAVYATDGGYVGDRKTSEQLAKRGIVPETIPGHNVSSIGWSDAEGKWFGWSHRAMYGFKIGDEVKPGDVTAESLPIGFKAASVDDAKAMAVAFANGVS